MGSLRMLYFVSIAVAAGSAAIYHLAMKNVPSSANPFLVLMLAYLMAATLSLGAFFFFSEGERSLIRFAPSCVPLALGVFGIELGVLLAYRAGAFVGTTALLVNVLCTVLLLPVGVLVMGERLSYERIAGIVLCCVGIFLLTKKS